MIRTTWVVLLFLLLPVAGARTVAQTCEDFDEDGYSVGAGCGAQDCNDADAAMNPAAVEVCNGFDDDCNGSIDDAPACDGTCDNPERMPVVHRVTLDDAVSTGRPDLVWVGDGWVAAWDHFYDGSCSEARIQRLDPAGNPVGSPVTIAGSEGTNRQLQHIELAWNGAELAVTWLEVSANATCTDISGQFHPYVQLFDLALQPLSSRQQLDCGVFDSSSHAQITWGRSRFGVTWPDDGIQFSTVDRDGNVAVACGQTIGPPVLETTQGSLPGIDWDGDFFGVAWEDAEPNTNFIDIHDEIYFRRIDEENISPDAEPNRITYNPSRSKHTSLIWADGEWGVAWADTRDNPGVNKNEIYIARLDPTGSKIDPPGDVRATCCNTATEGEPRRFNSLAWSGEEYGLIYLDETHPTDVTGDIFFQRIDSNGSPIGNTVLVTDDAKRNANHLAMVWNGEYYGIIWDDKPAGLTARQVYFTRIGCNCTDADGDQFTTCAGGDCLDDDPLSNPLAAESCLDGKDNNCDGPIDCQDTAVCTASSGATPGEVQGLTFGADKETLSWQAEPDSDVYDLLTGSLDELRGDGDFSRADCLVWRQTSTSHIETNTPSTGDGWYYLVRGKADRCRLGTWGDALRDEARLTCP